MDITRRDVLKWGTAASIITGVPVVFGGFGTLLGVEPRQPVSLYSLGALYGVLEGATIPRLQDESSRFLFRQMRDQRLSDLFLDGDSLATFKQDDIPYERITSHFSTPLLFTDGSPVKRVIAGLMHARRELFERYANKVVVHPKPLVTGMGAVAGYHYEGRIVVEPNNDPYVFASYLVHEASHARTGIEAPGVGMLETERRALEDQIAELSRLEPTPAMKKTRAYAESRLEVANILGNRAFEGMFRDAYPHGSFGDSVRTAPADFEKARRITRISFPELAGQLEGAAPASGTQNVDVPSIRVYGDTVREV